MTDLTERLKWARAYVEARLEVLLVRPREKRPLPGPDGGWWSFTEESPLVEALEAYPDANLALIVGRQKGSSILAVDIDGVEALGKARKMGVNSTDEAWIACTGGGGWHVVYYHPEELHFPRTVHPQGLPIDLLTNGYIVVEPSETVDRYRWVNGHSPVDIPLGELAPPPKGLVEWWLAQASVPREGDGDGSRIAGWEPGELERALDGVSKGERDDVGYRLACRYLAVGLRPEEVFLFLLAWGQRCNPAMGELAGDLDPHRWAEAKVKSALKAFRAGRIHRISRASKSRVIRIPDMEVGL